MMFERGMGDFCPWCGAGHGTTETLLLFFFGLLVIAGLVLLIVWLVRTVGEGGSRIGAGPQSSSEDSAIRTARERFARGEISRDEYEEIMRTLGS